MTPCIVTAPSGQFVIEDSYWTEDDYVDAIEQGGAGSKDVPHSRHAAGMTTVIGSHSTALQTASDLDTPRSVATMK